MFTGPTIITDGLVLALDAANLKSYNSGTSWKDLSGRANNATLVNGPTLVDGNGGSISLDGVNDYVTTFTTPASLQGNPSFTICSWMRRTANASGNTGTWGLSGDGNGINSWWNNNANEIAIDTWGQATFTTGVTYPLNEWVFVTWQKIAGPMTRANCILWRNLVSYTGNQLTVLRPESVAPNIGNNGINIGRISQTYGTPVAIQVGSFFIYSRVLTSSEITKNYNATKSRFGL